MTDQVSDLGDASTAFASGHHSVPFLNDTMRHHQIFLSHMYEISSSSLISMRFLLFLSSCELRVS